eukprot:1158938-Pelagomonas_calceolata.AAC.11
MHARMHTCGCEMPGDGLGGVAELWRPKPERCASYVMDPQVCQTIHARGASHSLDDTGSTLSEALKLFAMKNQSIPGRTLVPVKEGN